MNLAIIGAGESSRIKSEGFNTPKHLIKLKGEYLIQRIIRIARNQGAQKVICIINSKEPELMDYLLGNNFNIPMNLIIEDTPSSMHSLFALAPHLSKEPFCLATTDSVFREKEFADYIRYAMLKKDSDGLLAVTRYIDDEKPLCVAMDDKNNIVELSDSKKGYELATGGIYYFSPRIFDEIPYALEAKISKLRNFLRLLVAKGYVLKGYEFSKIIDVDHVSDIEKAESFLNGSGE